MEKREGVRGTHELVDEEVERLLVPRAECDERRCVCVGDGISFELGASDKFNNAPFLDEAATASKSSRNAWRSPSRAARFAASATA